MKMRIFQKSQVSEPWLAKKMHEEMLASEILRATILAGFFLLMFIFSTINIRINIRIN